YAAPFPSSGAHMARHSSRRSAPRIPTLPLSAAPALLLGVALTGGVSAHHGFGNFDTNQEVTLTGTVTKIDFVNPHAYVYFSVTGKDGANAPYRCEMRAATVLRRSGWSEQMFKAGDPITITGAPDRFDAHSCYVNTIAFADGTNADRYAQLSKPAQSTAPSACRSALEPRAVARAAGDGSAGAVAERRAEHLGRLGAGAGRHDGPARQE